MLHCLISTMAQISVSLHATRLQEKDSAATLDAAPDKRQRLGNIAHQAFQFKAAGFSRVVYGGQET